MSEYDVREKLVVYNKKCLKLFAKGQQERTFSLVSKLRSLKGES